MVLAGLAAASPASLVMSGHLLCYGIGRASLRLPRIGLTEAFGPGFDPGLPQSEQALDARVV